MYKRTLNLMQLLNKKSFFLFGPRGTGKTTLIKYSLPNAYRRGSIILFLNDLFCIKINSW